MRDYLRFLAIYSTMAVSGCIGIMRANEFKALPALAAAHTETATVNIEVIEKHWTSFDLLPLFVLFYFPPPHDLNLEYVIAGYSGCETLIIEEASIEFDDGNVVSMISRSEPLELQFVDFTEKDSSKSRKAGHRFRHAVSQNASFEVRVSGRLLHSDGTEQNVNIVRRVDGAVKTSVQDFVSWSSSI